MGRKPNKHKIIKERFDYLSIRSGYSQKMVGEITGYSREAINSSVNGRSGMSAEMLDAISQLFNVSPDYLTGENNYDERYSNIQTAFIKNYDPRRIDKDGIYIETYSNYTPALQTIETNNQAEEDLLKVIRNVLSLYPQLKELTPEEQNTFVMNRYADLRSIIGSYMFASADCYLSNGHNDSRNLNLLHEVMNTILKFETVDMSSLKIKESEPNA